MAVKGVIYNQEKTYSDLKIGGGFGGEAISEGAVLGGGGQRSGGIGGDDCTLWGGRL